MSYIRVLAVGVNTARFAPSIMTPTVRMGFSPSDLLNYQAPCGGSKPPPYGGASVHPLSLAYGQWREEQAPPVRMGFSPYGLLIFSDSSWVETWQSKTSHGEDIGEKRRYQWW